jgi:GDPmannose 4,6-dehydratase
MKKALITGITGQTGSYLAALLLKKNYTVYGIKRRTSSVYNTYRLEEIINLKKYYNKKLFIFYSDLNDYASLSDIVNKTEPDEIYNLAAQSHVQVSFEIPEYTTNVNAMGVLNLLNIIKNYNKKKIKFYQASTSEMFGDQNRMPLNERSIMEPASPYGISKLYAYHLVKNYRESYNIFASNGILFNHESPLRGENFITRKITIGLSEIYHGLKNTLEIGNINSRRDWGHAKDYAEAIWKILQIKKPIDLIISTNKSYSVRDFIKLCFKYMKIQIKFIGKGINEKVIDNNGKVWIKINKKYIRPKDINHLMGDSSLARKLIKWKNKTSFKNLAEEMIKKDLKRAEVLKKIKSIE